ncbi:MAG: hypothetical protein RMJ55_16285, partial [Roseiflexaceae bacterium]|nr:hypothetical protein [Roseiflexaceae bacterium]
PPTHGRATDARARPRRAPTMNLPACNVRHSRGRATMRVGASAARPYDEPSRLQRAPFARACHHARGRVRGAPLR